MRALSWVWLVGLLWSSACSSGGTSVQYCQSDSDCSGGMVCGTEACQGPTHCLRAECACEPGGFTNPCSVPPDACNCDHATCDHPLDSCGKNVCLGVCNLGQSCQFCVTSGGCDLAEPCLSSTCQIDGAGQAACRAGLCTSLSQPPQCGDASAPCGVCFQPKCDGIECGADPLTGSSCGTCPVLYYCDFTQHCVQPSSYALCAGDLSVMPDAIMPDVLAEAAPAPTGGTITDGTYDLVAEHEYGIGIPDIYEHAALRIFDAGVHAELMSDLDLDSPDYDSPHRLLTLSQADATTLNFDVTCPDMGVLFPHYTRGYSASGDDLWIFQPSLIEVYKKRP
jgi:hypothetical protein